MRHDRTPNRFLAKLETDAALQQNTILRYSNLRATAKPRLILGCSAF